MNDTPPNPSAPAPAASAEDAVLMRAVLRKARRRTFLAGLGVLVLGMLIGGAGVFLWMTHNGPPRPPPPRPPDGRDWTERLVQRFTRDLTLSEEQVASVRALMTEHGKEMEALRVEAIAAIEPHMAKLRADVSSLLTPEQNAIWQENFGERYFRGPGWQRGGGRPGGPGGPGGREGREGREPRDPREGRFGGPRRDGGAPPPPPAPVPE